jgi:predicted ATPase
VYTGIGPRVPADASVVGFVVRGVIRKKMAIQELTVKAFRSLRDARWRPGRLNLMVGPNGSGKSNLLRCLELISLAARGKLEATLAEVGGIVPLLWDHQPGSCGWRLRIDPVRSPKKEADALTYELELAQVRKGSAYEIVKDTLGNWHKYEQGREEAPYWIFTRNSRGAMIHDQRARKLVKLDAEDADSPEGYSAGESLLSQIADLRNRIPTLVRRILEGWSIHHDVHVERTSAMRQPSTTQYTKRLLPDGANLVTVLHTLYTESRPFRQSIDEGMRAAFGTEYERIEFQPAAAQQIQLAIQWKSSGQPHPASDLSDGTMRFLFLLTVLGHPEPAALVAIDEPETGLHPSMLPIIAEFAISAAEKTQVILTSHSPEFLDAFTSASPRVTLFHWEEGRTHLLDLDTEMLNRWLARYRLGHMFTRGDLESLSMPPVEPVSNGSERFKDLPSDLPGAFAGDE